MATKKYPETLVNLALDQVGIKESPAGSNNVKYNTWFYGRAVRGDAYPWCCACVNWLFVQAGMGDLFYGGKKSASCMTVEDYMHKAGQKVGINDGRYGDIVFFNFGSGRTRHIGIIVSKNDDGTYKTVEGNTSVTSDDNGGSVMIRNRAKSLISSICRPAYDMHPLIKITGTVKKFKKPNVKSAVLEKHTSNDKVRWVSDNKAGWSKIISLSDGEIGYIKNKYLDKKGLSTYPTYKTNKKAVIRVDNNNASSIKGEIPKGAVVSVITKNTKWSNITYKNVSGYIQTSLIDFK